MSKIVDALSPGLAQAMAQHSAAWRAFKSPPDDSDATGSRLCAEDARARAVVARFPCANDAELVAKLRHLFAYEIELTGERPTEFDDFGTVVVAVASYLKN